MFRFRGVFCFVGAIAALTGCGGKSTTIIYVLADAGPAAPAPIDASLGTGGSSGEAKPAPTLPEACQALCDRLAKANCVKANCAGNCALAVTYAACTDAYVKFLTCALAPDFVCDNGVADLADKACLDEKNAFYACRTGQAPTMYPPPPDAMDPEPPVEDAGQPFDAGAPTACPEIPSLPDTATCMGPDVPEAGNTEVWPVCLRTCADGLGNEWRSQCNGGKCVCYFNGKERCTSPCQPKPYECDPVCCF